MCKYLFLMVVLVCPAYCGDYLALNVGIKIGYQWSQTRSMVVGFECSCVRNHGSLNSNGLIYGAVLNIDAGSFGRKIHLGAQVSTTYGGIELGPSLVTPVNAKDELRTGMSTTLFTGALLYPYVGYTWLPEAEPLREAGVLLKYPQALSGTIVSFH